MLTRCEASIEIRCLNSTVAVSGTWLLFNICSFTAEAYPVLPAARNVRSSDDLRISLGISSSRATGINCLATGSLPLSSGTVSAIIESSLFPAPASISITPEASPLEETITRIFPGFPVDLTTLEHGNPEAQTPSRRFSSPTPSGTDGGAPCPRPWPRLWPSCSRGPAAGSGPW